MQDEQEELVPEFQDWFDGADIFFRSKDKQRFQLSLEAVSHGDRGLAVIGGNDGVLDHYSRLLVTRLRDLEGFQLEVFLPNDTDSLLNRFNQILAKMTMEQARKLPEASAPVHLLVVNDAKSVKQDQWNLLVRLITDFPGINVRLILCIDKTGWPGYEKLLAMFGRQLYRWVVDTPTVDEAIQLTYAAREHGYESDTELLLEQVGLGDVVAPDDSEIMPGDIDILSEDTLMQDIGGGLVFPDDPFNFDTEKNAEAGRVVDGTSSKLRDAALVAAICLLSLAVTLFVIYRFNPIESMHYRDAALNALGQWQTSIFGVFSKASLDVDVSTEAPEEILSVDPMTGLPPTDDTDQSPALDTAAGRTTTVIDDRRIPIADGVVRRVRAGNVVDPTAEQLMLDISEQFAGLREEQNRPQTSPSTTTFGTADDGSPSLTDQELRKQLGQIEALLAAVEREQTLAAERQFGELEQASASSTSEAAATSVQESQESQESQENQSVPTNEVGQIERAASVELSGPMATLQEISGLPEIALPEQIARPQQVAVTTPRIDPIRPLADEIVTVIEAPQPIRTPVAVTRVRNARPTDFFVQYIVFTSQLQAASFIDGYVGLAGALVVPISLRGRPAYAVVSGPFVSLGDAKEFSGGERLPKDYWFRSATRMKGALRVDD
jgi:hypothetical protein